MNNVPLGSAFSKALGFFQVIGVPKSLEENIETSFEECAQEYCMELTRIPEEKDLTEVCQSQAFLLPFDVRFLRAITTDL